MITGVVTKPEALVKNMTASHYLLSERRHREAIERARTAVRAAQRRLQTVEREASEARARVSALLGEGVVLPCSSNGGRP